jgi:glutamate-1-semialdehyde aminotransferase
MMANPMSNSVKDFERVLSAQRIADRFAMEFDSPEALAKYLKDHPKADKSKHKVKKSEPTESAKAIKEFQDAGSKFKAEHVEGVGHHLAPGGVIPLKEHDAKAISKKHTQAQIQKSLEAVNSRLKHVHGEEAKDFEKTKKTLEKALWYSVGDSIDEDRQKKARGTAG